MRSLQNLVWISSLGLVLALGTTVGCSSSSNKSNGGSGGSTGGSSGSAGSSTGGSSTGGSAGSSTGGSAGSSTGGSAGSSTGGSAGSSTGGSAGAGGSGGCTNGMVPLTVKNYLSWCSFSVSPASGTGVSDFTGSETTVCVAPGSVGLSATALPNFELGNAPWHDTDGDNGSGDPGTVTGSGQSAKSSTTETVGSSADCVWVCCPGVNGSAPCPKIDQCP